MPSSEPTGKYRPTWKLSEKDRNAKYTHKKIERIMRQVGRPWTTRARALNKLELIALWMAQDQQIKYAKGKRSKDYVSVPGQDGLPNRALGETTDDESSDEDDSDDDGHAEDVRKSVERNSNHEDDDAVDDEGMVNAEDNAQQVAGGASGTEDDIEVPTIPSMKMDLKKWGIKVGYDRTRAPMFSEKWKPEFLRRRAAEQSKEIEPANPVENNDDAVLEGDGDTDEAERGKSRETRPRKRKRDASEDVQTDKRAKPNDLKAKKRTAGPGKPQQDTDVQMSGTDEPVAVRPHDQLPVAHVKKAASLEKLKSSVHHSLKTLTPRAVHHKMRETIPHSEDLASGKKEDIDARVNSRPERDATSQAINDESSSTHNQVDIEASDLEGDGGEEETDEEDEESVDEDDEEDVDVMHPKHDAAETSVGQKHGAASGHLKGNAAPGKMKNNKTDCYMYRPTYAEAKRWNPAYLGAAAQVMLAEIMLQGQREDAAREGRPLPIAKPRPYRYKYRG